MLPSAGQGAINAMQDATILANCINDIKTVTTKHISAALKDYQDQRYQHAKNQFETSKRFAVIMGGQVTLPFSSLYSLIREEGSIVAALSLLVILTLLLISLSRLSKKDMDRNHYPQTSPKLHAQVIKPTPTGQDVCLPTTSKFLEASSRQRCHPCASSSPFKTLLDQSSRAGDVNT